MKTTTFELSASELALDFKHILVEINENEYVSRVCLRTENDISKQVRGIWNI